MLKKDNGQLKISPFCIKKFLFHEVIIFGTLFEIFFIHLPNQIGKMKKKYFYTILLAVFLVSLTVSAQENKPQQPNKTQETTIEGLSFYPNPVSNGKVYITSKSSLAKEVTIFDILGKVVLQSTINTKELNVSSLSPGIYMIKIKEGEATATRKLIIK